MAHARCPRCRVVSDFKVDEDQEDRRRTAYKEDDDGYLQVDYCRVCGHGGIERSADQGGYFNRELSVAFEEWPRMGRLCSHCDRRIPRFLDLAPETATQLRKLIDRGQGATAARRLRDATGCPERWAHLWVEHPDGAAPDMP